MRGALIMTGPLAGLAGGDVHALRFVAAWEERWPGTIDLVAPPMMRQHLPAEAHGAMRELRTPLDERVGSNIGLYALNLLLRMALVTLRGPRVDVDVCDSHMWHDVIPAILRRLTRRNRLIATWVHHLIAEERPARGLRNRGAIALERFSLALLRRTGALVFYVSENGRRSLLAMGFAPDQLRLSGNAYDPWIPVPPRAPAGEPTVVVVGRLTEEKGIWDALEVARRIDARVQIIGDGTLREQVEARASEIDGVELCGFVSEEEKWRRLRAAHVFLAPSREEGWGVAVGEALTAGLPVVAYDLPAYERFAEMIVRVPIGDVDALAAATATELDSGRRTGAAVELHTWAPILAAELDELDSRLARG